MNYNTQSLLNVSRLPSRNGGLPFALSGAFTRNSYVKAALAIRPRNVTARNTTAGPQINALAVPANFSPLSASKSDEIALIQSP